MARYLQTDREVPFAKSDPKKLLNSSPIFSSYVVSVMNLKRSRNVKKIGAIFFGSDSILSLWPSLAIPSDGLYFTAPRILYSDGSGTRILGFRYVFGSAVDK